MGCRIMNVMEDSEGVSCLYRISGHLSSYPGKAAPGHTPEQDLLAGVQKPIDILSLVLLIED